MDVVKTNIEKIGGTVDLQSEGAGQGHDGQDQDSADAGHHPALIVTSGGDRFAIPQVSLLELVRLEPTGPKRGIEPSRRAGLPAARQSAAAGLP
jgi:two-component system, chemotaxis family, sensor kinase CheA